MTRPKTIPRLQWQPALTNKIWDGQRAKKVEGRWSDRWSDAQRRGRSTIYWWKVKGSPGAHADSERQVITSKRASLLTGKGFRAHLCPGWQKQSAFSICCPQRKGESDAGGGTGWLNGCWHASIRSCFGSIELLIKKKKNRAAESRGHKKRSEVRKCLIFGDVASCEALSGRSDKTSNV